MCWSVTVIIVSKHLLFFRMPVGPPIYFKFGQAPCEILHTDSNNLSLVINALCYPLQKNISDALLVALNNTQSALLTFKNANEGPTIIKQGHISVFVNR